MRCFTDEELLRGLIAVIQEWDRCATCGAPNDDDHDASPHAFVAVPLIDVFLKGVSQQADDAEPRDP